MKYARLVTSLLLDCVGDEFKCLPPALNCPPFVVFSGTQSLKDLLIYDLNIKPTLWPPKKYSSELVGGRVHGGFAARTNRLYSKIDDFIEQHDNFVLGGHSLGGSCSILLASLLKAQGKNISSVYTFGVPKLATTEFEIYYKNQDLWTKTHNFVTPRDPVVNKIPYLYRSVGQYTELDFHSDSAWEHHDLSTYHNCLVE